jgi:hypothetical protein
MSAELLAVVRSKEFHDKLVPSGIEPAPSRCRVHRVHQGGARAPRRVALKAKMQAD